MEKRYRKENDCLNCGTKLKGKFCYNCGQENLLVKESFGHMMNHAISDYFHFDHQFFHTLKPLFIKPGFLTNEYMAGRRAKYLHPVKMYIFISLVYFVVFFQSGHKLMSVENNSLSPKEARVAIDKINKDATIPAYEKEMLTQKIKDQEDTTILKNGNVHINYKAVDDDNANFIVPTTSSANYRDYILAQQKLPANKRDGFFERMYNRKVFAYKTEYGSRTRDVIVEEFQHNIPKMMFLLLPFYALILMITFKSDKKYYVEYLIYSFHLHCFVFLFLTIIMLLQLIIPSDVINGMLTFFSTLAVAWYIYRSLRVVYGRSRWRTISKMIGTTVIYLGGFTICIVLVFVITALMA